jgi:hypothetical protein
MLRALLIQLDGKHPNHALLRLSAHLKNSGHEVSFRRISNPRNIEAGLWDDFDQVYASTIFDWTRPIAQRLLEIYPHAIIGGPGWSRSVTLEAHGVRGMDKDYSIYPDYQNSMGYTQRGCRMSGPKSPCRDWCVVPEMEGFVHPAEPFLQIWRGEPYPRNVILMDNDFFGLPTWRESIKAMRDGNFKVSFNQGVNARFFDEESAAAIASVRYYDSDFTTRTIYCAWDDGLAITRKGDDAETHESRLFRGLRALKVNGVRPDNITVYMLCGGPGDTPANREYRRVKLREFGCRPYPMPFVRTRELVGFQRLIVRRADLKMSWTEYSAANWRPEDVKRGEPDEPLFRILQDVA